MLSCIVSCLSPNLENDQSLYADLPGHRASDSPPSTIPPDILSTSCRPDLILLQEKSIKLLELTVCGNTTEGFANARSRKQTKQDYISLLNDLESTGYTVSYDTIEVGSLGHCTHLTQRALRCFAPSSLSKSQHSELIKRLARTSISCSHTIFMARESSEWDTHKPLFTV